MESERMSNFLPRGQPQNRSLTREVLSRTAHFAKKGILPFVRLQPVAPAVTRYRSLTGRSILISFSEAKSSILAIHEALDDRRKLRDQN
jgi:hypothetical protein